MRGRLADDGFNDYVLDQLGDLGDVGTRSMFGGYGVYRGDDFFGIVFDGRLYFRTDESTRDAYIAQGSGPFQPTPRQRLKNYYEVPADVIEDRAQLVEWAREAVE